MQHHLPHRLRDDRGAGAVLALAIIAAVVALTLITVTATAAFAARQRTVSAADAAALAAADVRPGVVGGVPCTVAARVAQANGAALVSCTVKGATASVTAESWVLGVPVRVSATAGPP